MSDATVDPILNPEAAPMFDDDGKPITYRVTPVAQLLAMSEDEKAAHLEFKAAAQEARATQEAAQRAAKRYADAVRRLSEVCAPPSITPRGDSHD